MPLLNAAHTRAYQLILYDHVEHGSWVDKAEYTNFSCFILRLRPQLIRLSSVERKVTGSLCSLLWLFNDALSTT